MKLIIQIPCLNEARTLPATVAQLPRALDGVDVIEYLVIDDGSQDGTRHVAEELGVDHIVVHRRTLGLARAFRTGMDRALALDADIVVNTDGDNQYNGEDISTLIRPIVCGEADIVVGDRGVASHSEFTRTKRFLQRLGSSVVRRFSGTSIADAVSGFRAVSRDAAMRLNILSEFSYTTEMLIQANHKGLTIVSVPVRVNPKTRESRLFRTIPEFLRRSAATILRVYAMFRPLRVFLLLGAVLTTVGAVPILRFLYFYLGGSGAGHVQSLVLGGVLVTLGFVAFMIGIVADLISFNRQLVEIVLEKTRSIELRLATKQEDPPVATVTRLGPKHSRIASPLPDAPGLRPTVPQARAKGSIPEHR